MSLQRVMDFINKISDNLVNAFNNAYRTLKNDCKNGNNLIIALSLLFFAIAGAVLAKSEIEEQNHVHNRYNYVDAKVLQADSYSRGYVFNAAGRREVCAR